MGIAPFLLIPQTKIKKYLRSEMHASSNNVSSALLDMGHVAFFALLLNEHQRIFHSA